MDLNGQGIGNRGRTSEECVGYAITVRSFDIFSHCTHTHKSAPTLYPHCTRTVPTLYPHDEHAQSTCVRHALPPTHTTSNLRSFFLRQYPSLSQLMQSKPKKPVGPRSPEQEEADASAAIFRFMKKASLKNKTRETGKADAVGAVAMASFAL
jgi:hypothetical protein